MVRKIVADSSANKTGTLFHNVAFESVPLKIITPSREFPDTESLAIPDMLDYIEKSGEKAGTSCPNSEEWIRAFGDADEVYAFTISSGLSGSYAAANVAKQEFEELHPDKKIHIFDSLGTGPRMALMMEKLVQEIELGNSFEKIVENVTAYRAKVGILFSLESYTNLSRAGRVSPAVAAIAAMLGIHVLGTASEEGTISIVKNSRGSKKALSAIVNEMISQGYRGGRVDLVHCLNEAARDKLTELIQSAYPQASITTGPCRGLCSYYAERKGLIISFER